MLGVALVLCVFVSPADSSAKIHIYRHDEIPVSTRGIPDMSSDFRFHDVADEHTMAVRFENYDKPDRCRTDICNTSETSDGRKGLFSWRSVEAGFTMHLRCPYSLEGVPGFVQTYASRHCMLNTTTYTANWQDPNITNCPGPSFAQVAAYYGRMTRSREFMTQDRIANMMKNIWTNIGKYSQQPFFYDDVSSLDTTFNEIFRAGIINIRLEYRSINYFMKILDFFTEKKLWSVSFHGRLPVMAASLSRMLIPHGQITENTAMVTSVIQIAILKYTDPEVEFHLPVNYEGGTWDAEYKLAISSNASLNAQSYVVVGVVANAWNYILNYQESVRPIIYVSLWDGVTQIFTTPTISFKAIKIPNMHRQSQLCRAVSLGDRYFTKAPATLPRYWSSHPCIMVDSWHCSCEVSGYMAFFRRAFDLVLIPEWFSVPLPEGIESPILWSSPSPSETTIHHMQTIDVVLGFPFNWPLYIAGHVLRGFGQLGLILTVIMFSKTRKGVPTRILLHLCCTLLALNILLYVTEQVANHRVGCRTSNIAIYCLVMSSLLWNGAEAVNMYLMLIKIMDSHVRYFVVKAAIVAYGLPVLVAAAILAAYWRAFDGIYDDNCQFICRLGDRMLYYGYLLPLGLILVHNLAIFGLVLRTLLTRNKRANNNPGSRRSVWARLGGAVSLLILLGVPWGFSAFGAIDDMSQNVHLDTLQQVFQVIFIVCFNLQGVFIFCFHCARNTELLNSWKTTVASMGTRSTNVQSRSSTST